MGGVICPGGGSSAQIFEISQGLKFKADFHSKMGVCRHELGVGGSTPPQQFQP